ncbi:MAG TPA: dihydropteroate synthase [Candidatus Latescibacteria bacterium]|nr:dihydropteroate synthase [Candidatus Latescibacterota bacterium]
MILIGENINAMSKTVGPAMKERNTKVIQELAVAQQEAGMDYLDINIGPAKREGPELMEWMVKTVQEVVDLPLFLDTTNVEAIEAGLKAHKGKAVINSISCRPERMEILFPLVKKYEASFVGLLLGVEGIPRDAAERGALAAELLAKAAEAGIPNEDIWLDPIVLPVSSQQEQVKGCTEFMEMLKDLAPNCKSTCGLSNVSNGAPAELRPILNKTYLIMLGKYGLCSAIVNAFDKELIEIARGGRADLAKLVHQVMDGEKVDLKALTQEEIDYVKTAKLLLGHSLYSHSWLKL